MVSPLFFPNSNQLVQNSGTNNGIRMVIPAKAVQKRSECKGSSGGRGIEMPKGVIDQRGIIKPKAFMVSHLFVHDSNTG